MKRHFLTLFFVIVSLICLAFGTTACKKENNNDKWGEVYTVEAAYSVAADLGYTGTLDEFIVLISGKDGKDGANGIDGIDGKDGKDGTNGTDGINGKDGKDGVGIKSVQLNDNGELVITNTNNEVIYQDRMPQCKHNYTDWEIGLLPTCISLGYNFRVCEKCANKDYMFIEATGHSWDNGTVIIESDCIKAGVKLYSCLNCQTTKSEPIDISGHNFEERVCKVCGELKASEGLSFYDDMSSYVSVRIGSCTDTTIIIPKHYNGKPVSNIPDYAFKNCANIKEVIIQGNINSIGREAFSNCSNLVKITFPEVVYEIGIYAFENCYSLQSVNIPDSITVIRNSTFADCISLTEVTMGDKVKSIETSAFNSCYKLKNITIPDSVTIIEDRAFYGIKLERVNLGAGLLSIGQSAFSESKADVYYSGSLEDWCRIIFVNERSNPLGYGKSLCINNACVTELIIPESITKINDNAFFWCGSLTSVVIHENVTSIGEDAFYYCDNIKSLIISKSVTEIKDSAFELSANGNIEIIYYTGSSEEWAKISIGNRNYNLGNDVEVNEAIKYFYSAEQPAEEGNYWHYVDGEVVVW